LPHGIWLLRIGIEWVAVDGIELQTSSRASELTTACLAAAPPDPADPQQQMCTSLESYVNISMQQN
jgi:hypothetical protein